jgi:hypothetical protein
MGDAMTEACVYCGDTLNDEHIIKYRHSDGSRVYETPLHIWCVALWIMRKAMHP